GTEFDYTITVTNNGPSTAAMVSVTDTLPPSQTLAAVPDLSGAPGFVCTPDAVGSGGVITCTAPALAPDKKPDGTPHPAGTAVIRFRVRQDALTPQPTPVTYKNCVTAGSMSFDPDPANNTNYCDTVNVIFRADLATAKTDTPDPVIAGRELTYTITAVNNGQSAALNMMVSDPLPAGTVFVSASAPGSSALITPAAGANGIVKATWAGLTAPGVTRTVTIVVRVCSEVACNTTLTNTATASSETTDPKPSDNAATTTTLVQAQADLAISKTGAPNPVAPGQQVTCTLSFSNRGPSGSVGTVVTDVLPVGFRVVGTPTSTVPGTTFAITTANDVTTVKATLGVLGAASQCATTTPTSGTISIVALVPDKHPISTVINTASIATANCLADPDLSNNTATFSTSVNRTQDQGFPFPASDEASDQKGGSVLIYPIYTSSASNPAIENTLINLTNTSDQDQVCVHLFIIDGDTCSAADVNVCLTANQTVSFQAADFDPGTTGYLVAVAVDCLTGLPKSFNCLVGDSYVKFASGHAANLAAVSVSALVYDPAGTDQTTNKADLKFDGVHYNRLPRVVAMDSIVSRAEGNSTMLILNRPGGDLNRSAPGLGAIFGYLYNDTEDAFSFTANQAKCQARVLLSNSFPRIFGGFTNAISAGRSGWIKLWLDDDAPVIGSMITFNPNSGSQTSYSQGHNLHTLTLNDKAVLTVPVARPSC
ncbi:MAG TPA: DUF11 domain-containing protein, partial [Blastocatellia bacterium]|nr:DUF11 domain-containing protein [Blastocatellia bacterium]